MNMTPEPVLNQSDIIRAGHLNFYYGDKQALHDITLNIKSNSVTALIGPSGCGKSTFLRCINRMNDLIDNTKSTGNLFFNDFDVLDQTTDVIKLRRRIGMVFQKSNPFPKSIFENVVYGLKIAGVRQRSVLEAACQRSLERAALWEEVKDRLHESAMGLSGGQMQRLCIARAIAVDPDILLMDEPCSALDPRSTARIEDLINTLKEKFTIIIVTHNMQQASRISEETVFFNEGRLVEFGKTRDIFTKPQITETEDYITGRFG